MEATKVTIGQKTFDLNYLNKTKKSALRRKLIVEYIESKSAGQTIKMTEFQKLGHFNTSQNTAQFVQRMVRDGVISRYAGDRPRTYYYAVLGSVRRKDRGEISQSIPKGSDFTAVLASLKDSGLEFTLTVSNKTKD